MKHILWNICLHQWHFLLIGGSTQMAILRKHISCFMSLKMRKPNRLIVLNISAWESGFGFQFKCSGCIVGTVSCEYLMGWQGESGMCRNVPGRSTANKVYRVSFSCRWGLKMKAAIVWPTLDNSSKMFSSHKVTKPSCCSSVFCSLLFVLLCPICPFFSFPVHWVSNSDFLLLSAAKFKSYQSSWLYCRRNSSSVWLNLFRTDAPLTHHLAWK